MDAQINHWAKESIEKLKRTKVEHRNWINAYNDIKDALLAAQAEEVITLCGPSRGGKSTLINEVITEMMLPYRDSSKMPIVLITARNESRDGQFSTKSLTMNGLDKIEHPFYNSSFVNIDTKPLLRSKNTPETILRPALIDGLKAKGVRIIVIDEAGHIKHAPGGLKSAEAILDSWKCLVEEVGAILIFVSAYSILEVLLKSAHAEGREQLIHFPRYYESKDDIKVFNEILETYSGLVSLSSKTGSLCCWNKMLYQGSLGCIGLLNKWIRHALSKAVSDKSDYLLKEHFLRTQKTSSSLNTIRNDIEAGEKLLGYDFPLHDEESYDQELKIKDSVRRHRKPFQKKARRIKANNRLSE